MSETEGERDVSDGVKGFVNMSPPDDELAEEVYSVIPYSRYVRACEIAEDVGVSSQRVAALIKKYLEDRVEKEQLIVREWGTHILHYKKRSEPAMDEG
ncbi:MAG: hypothetical protein ACLFVP_06185 [Candidatus Bathyarchaeia archaeon]